MEDVMLARLEPHQLTNEKAQNNHSRWRTVAEAACWLRTDIRELFADIELYLDYADEINHYRVLIDKCKASHFCDTLLTGRFEFKGVGKLKSARLILKSTNQQALPDYYTVDFSTLDAKGKRRALLLA